MSINYQSIYLDAIGYELAPVVVSTRELEERIRPVYEKLHIPVGQLEVLTGIKERRWWQPNSRLSDGAISAGTKALQSAGLSANDLGALIYAGVCREQFEPATACRVAAELGLPADAIIHDISNACLGVLSGMIDIANRISLGQIKAGMVVSSESAREINEIMIARMLDNPTMEFFVSSLATLTGGSGSVAVILTDGSFGNQNRQLHGGAIKAAPQFNELCLWGDYPTDQLGLYQQQMQTDSIKVMQNGVQLGIDTWNALLANMGWSKDDVDKLVCHQVGSSHQKEFLKSIDMPVEKDFTTFGYLGNIGTVALPMAAAIAEERGHLQTGDKVGFLGIGSGLNCMMMGLTW